MRKTGTTYTTKGKVWRTERVHTPFGTSKGCKCVHCASYWYREVCIPAKWPIFCSMKQLRIYALLPGWDASPLQGYTQHYKFSGTHDHLYNRVGEVL